MAADAKMAHPPSSRFTPLNVHWTFTLWVRSFTFVSGSKSHGHGPFHLFKIFCLHKICKKFEYIQELAYNLF